MLQFIGFLVVTAIVLGIMAIYGYAKESKTQKQIREEQEIQEYETFTINFYNLCKENGISMYPLSPYGLNKIQEIAKANNINISKSEEFYYTGYNNVKSKLRKQENDLKESTITKTEFPGCSKYIHELLITFQNDYNNYLDIYNKASGIVQKKKQTWAHTRSWATAGGFAEAIGGVGVGVATALKVQADNIKAEESARATRNKAYETIFEAENGDAELTKLIKNLTNEFMEIEEFLSTTKKTTISPDQFNVKSFDVKESGSLYLTITPKAKEINKSKILDGIVYVKVIKNNTIVGGGYITSPGYLNSFKEKENNEIINQIGLENFTSKEIVCFPNNGCFFENNENYKFEFVSINTWNIDLEQLKKHYKSLFYRYDRYSYKKQEILLSLVSTAMTL